MTGSAAIRTENFQGQDILPWLGALSALRIEIFRDWPYLYEGSAEYEQAYLRVYARSARALVVIAFDGETPVGASTCLPLTEAGEDMIAPVEALGMAPERIFYFGESVLRPAYRGQGLGRAFFKAREAQALADGVCDTAMFYAVRRAADHPARPAGAASLELFWRHRGFAPLPGLSCQMAWREIGQTEHVKNTLDAWIKPLRAGGLTA